MADVTIARLDEIEPLDDGRQPLRAVRHALGITTFGITAWTARADGDQLINAHDEAEPDSSEELYFVHSGHARFEVGGETIEAPAGTFVRVGPGVMRSAFARDAGTTLLAIGGAAPGRVYRVHGWELLSPAMELYRAGEYAQAADAGAALLADDPPYAIAFFNVACFEALAGRPERALSHLRRAIELDPGARALALADDDLAALRDRPEFAELTAG